MVATNCSNTGWFSRVTGSDRKLCICMYVLSWILNRKREYEYVQIYLAHKWANHMGQYLLRADDSNSDAGGISCLYKIWSMIITSLRPVDTILNHFKLAHTFILRFFEIHFYSFIYIYVSHAFLPLSIPTKILYTLLTSTICAMWSAQLSLPELIILYITWRLQSKKFPSV